MKRRRAIGCVPLLVAASCASSHSSSHGASGDAGGAGHDGSTGMTEAGGGGADAAIVGDAGPVTPPIAICTAPLSAADTSTPTTVVGTGTAASCTAPLLTSALMTG